MRSTPLLLVVALLAAAALLYVSTRDDENSQAIDQRDVSQTTGDVAHDLQSAELPAGGSALSQGDRQSIANDSAAQVSRVDSKAPLAAVEANELRGQILDEEGQPLAGCRVVFLTFGSGERLWSARPASGLEGEPEMVTAQDGRFRFESLPPGDDHALYVHHPEIALYLASNVLVEPYGVSEQPPIVLRYGKRIRGTVTNESGLPLEGVRIHLDGRWIATNPVASLDRLSATTDFEGHYEIRGAPDGKRCLTAEAEGLATMTRTQSLVLSDQTGQVHVMDFTLRAAAVLAGRVAEEDGPGIAGAAVIAVDINAYHVVPNSRTLTRDDGSFEMPALAPGTYRVRVMADGYMDFFQDSVVAPSEGVEFLLEPRAMTHGLVVDAETGEPLSDFTIRLRRSPNEDGMGSLPTTAVFRFRGVERGEFRVPAFDPEGKWLAEATAAGYAPSYSRPFHSSANLVSFDVIIPATRGGAIHGRVVRPSGEPVAGARITSRDNAWADDFLTRAMGSSFPSDATTATAHSDANGEFVLRNLHAATYRVIVDGPNLHEVEVGGIEVVEGTQVEVGDVTLFAGASMRGALVDAEGSPVSDGVVVLNPSGLDGTLSIRRTKSGAGGEWRLTNVTPGSYRLTGRPPAIDQDPSMIWPSRSEGEPVVLTGGIEDVRDVHLHDWTKPKPPPPKPPTGSVGGKVLGTSGEGAVGRAIELVPVQAGPLFPHSSKTERGGEFAFLGVLPGEYQLFVSGLSDTAVTLQVLADRWVRHDLQLPE